MKKIAIGIKDKGISAHRYITQDIFCIDLGDIPKIKAKAIQSLKILVLSIQKFMLDKCPLRASALTFYSLLSIVPVAALAFGIAKGFGLEKRLEHELYLRFAGQQEVLNFVIEFARSLLENTKGGIVAGIGVLALLISVVKVLIHIEDAFNLIWNVKSRTFDRKFSDYLAIMLTGPLLFIIASSVTVFIKTQVETFTANVAILGFISPIIFLGLKLLPFVLIWLLFTIVYIIMPNTRVRFGSAFIAGMAAGTLYQLTQTAYINFQIFVANYNAVYGSFAALPLFLGWLQISWLILLLGAEISHAHHTADTYGCMPYNNGISFNQKKAIAIQVVHFIVKRFEEGVLPATAGDIAAHLKLPLHIVQEVITTLAGEGLISPTILADRHSPGFQPGRDIQTISVQTVIQILDDPGNSKFRIPPTPLQDKLSQYLKTLAEEAGNSNTNYLLKDL